MATKKKLIASSGTEEGLMKLINQYYYSQHYIIKDGKAFNTKLNIFRGEVKKHKNRFKFFLKIY